MFQNEIILYTLSHAHLIEYDDVPNPDDLEDDEKPVGALILALQAVRISVFSCVRCRQADLSFD